jgi:hypothetical protein
MAVKNKLVIGLFVFSVLLLAFSGGSGQGLCVIEQIKVSEVKGLVMLPNKIPIPDATIELHETNSEGRLVARTKTDANGRFKLNDIRKGKYAVVASYPTLVTLHVPTRVSPSKSPKKKLKEIVIILEGLIDKPCGGGDAYGQDEPQPKQQTSISKGSPYKGKERGRLAILPFQLSPTGNCHASKPD